MASPIQIEVDLSDMSRLYEVRRDYLNLSVCPVFGHPSPGLLVNVTVILKLPGDAKVASLGKVIQELSADSFLVQLDTMPDIEGVLRMIQEPAPSVRADVPYFHTEPQHQTYHEKPATVQATGRRMTGGIEAELVGTVEPDRTASSPLTAFKDIPEVQVIGVTEVEAVIADLLPPDIDIEVVAEPTKQSVAPAIEEAAPLPILSAAEVLGVAVAQAESPVLPTKQTGRTPNLSASGEGRLVELVDTLIDPSLDFGMVGKPFPAKVATKQDTAVKEPVHSEVVKQEVSSEQVEPSPSDDAEVTGKETESSDVYARIKNLSLPEKQKLARYGKRTVRQLLIRDPNKNLHRLVVGNPDVGLDEITEYSAYPGLSKEAIEFIAQNRTWLASRQLVFNLVRNPSTPVELAVRLVPRLGPNEWRWLARPGAVREPIAAAARRQIIEGSLS